MSDDKEPGWFARFMTRLVTPKRVQSFGMRTVRELLNSAVAALDEEIAKMEAVDVTPPGPEKPKDPELQRDRV